MERCNELCTKATTGYCALCEARTEADRFSRFWFQGGVFHEGIHVMRRRGVFAVLHRSAFPLVLLCVVGLMLWSAWFLPRSSAWRSTVSHVVQENPVFVGALLISLVLSFFWLLLWKLPQRQVAALPKLKDRIDLESKVRQTMAQILGGAAFLVGLYFTSQTLQVSQQALQVSQQGQITDRFTKAIDQLGKLGQNTLAVRLGGIYALERIARDSESDHRAVMEVLTAFVRNQAPATPMPLDTAAGKGETKESPPADVQAILTVIGRRTQTFGNGETKPLDLRNTNLQGANLAEAQLQDANLTEAQLQRAGLFGAQLQDANLAEAQLQDANLTEAQLQRAILTKAQLQRAKLEGAQLQDAKLWKAQLQDANLEGAQLQDANLAEAELQGAKLEGAQLQGAKLWKAQLQGADLRLAKTLTQDQINIACVGENTQLPEGLTKPPPCPARR